jgi:hypothetical protein
MWNLPSALHHSSGCVYSPVNSTTPDGLFMRRSSLALWTLLPLLLAAAIALAKGQRRAKRARLRACIEACIARDQMRAVTIEKIRTDCEAECARPPEDPPPRDADQSP